MTVMKLSLQKLSERWLSAVGPLRALNKLTEKVRELEPFDGAPTLDFDTVAFFEGFDVKMCKQWRLVGQASDSETTNAITTTCTLAEVQDPEAALPAFEARPDETVENYASPTLDTGIELFGTDWEGSGFDWSGSWLLNV